MRKRLDHRPYPVAIELLKRAVMAMNAVGNGQQEHAGRLQDPMQFPNGQSKIVRPVFRIGFPAGVVRIVTADMLQRRNTNHDVEEGIARRNVAKISVEIRDSSLPVTFRFRREREDRQLFVAEKGMIEKGFVIEGRSGVEKRSGRNFSLVAFHPI